MALCSPVEKREIDIQAQSRDVAPAAVLDADGCALGRAAIGKTIRVVGDHRGKVRIGQAGQSQLGGRIPGRTARQIVVDLEHRMVGVEQIVDHDLAEGRKRLAQALGDVPDLRQQELLLGTAGRLRR